MKENDHLDRLELVEKAVDNCRTVEVHPRLARDVHTFSLALQGHVVKKTMEADHTTPVFQEYLKRASQLNAKIFLIETVKAP